MNPHRNPHRVLVRVPASTANLGPGFDTIGMALELYAWIEMAFAEETRIRMEPDHSAVIPADKSNVVYRAAQNVFAAAGEHHPELSINIRSDIPLARGLGSSASAIVGALYAANALIGGKFSDDELFQMAARMEDHPDNVGASIFGGIVVASWDGERADHIRIEPDPRLEVLLAVPEYHLATDKARSVLPERVSLKDAVFNVSHASLLVAALCSGNLPMIRRAMKDALHQPYRCPLIPGMETVLREAWRYGALGVALSGAGPTLLAFVERGDPVSERLSAFMSETMRGHGARVEMMRLRPSAEGVRILTPEDDHSTLFAKIKGDPEG